MSAGNLVFQQKPQLHHPYMIAGFAGWPDASEAGTQSVLYLVDTLKAKKFASLEGEAFYNLIAQRPRARTENGVLRRIRFPSNEFFFWQGENQPHDLILFLGVEPHYRWRSYVELVISVATKVGVEKCITLGGTYDQVPHSRPTRISAVVNRPEQKGEVESFSVGISNYEGPCSIQTSLLMALKQKGVGGISLWAHAPYYIQLANVKVCHGLLQQLASLLHLPLELSGLARQGRYLDFQLAQAMEGQPELAEHVKQLESLYESATELPQGQELISEIEKFLHQPTEKDED